MKTATAIVIAATLAATAAAYGSAPERYGPVINPGSPDAAVMLEGRPVQIEYLHCWPAIRAGAAGVILWEDGSITC